MAKRGRKPKPTAMKIAAGNPGKHSLPENEPEPDIRAPRCPSHLSKRAKSEWRRIVKHLVDLGIVSELDRVALASYCEVYARWIKAEQEIEKYGLTYWEGDAMRKNAAVPIAERCVEQLRKLASEFGLTPSARSNVHARPPGSTDDEEAKARRERLFGKKSA